MRLSYGFVRENRLTCLYHGWGYDGEGACVSIPAHPGLTPPKSIKVTRYRCHEAGGLIWVAREGSEEAAPAVSGEWIACQSLKFDCSIEAAEDALVLHRGALLSSGSTKSGQEPSVSVSKAGRGLLTFRADAGFEATCALQPIDDGATIVHLLVKATGTDGDVAPEQRCARWGRYVRSEVKAGAPRSHSAKTENATLVVAS